MFGVLLGNAPSPFALPRQPASPHVIKQLRRLIVCVYNFLLRRLISVIPDSEAAVSLRSAVSLNVAVYLVGFSLFLYTDVRFEIIIFIFYSVSTTTTSRRI